MTGEEREREALADDLGRRFRRAYRVLGEGSLRWILFHLIEETARHNGHIDIVRELADGVTGT